MRGRTKRWFGSQACINLRTKLAVAVVGFLALLVTLSSDVGAKTDSEDTYIAGLDQGQRYGLYILGDSFAADLAYGLKWALRDQRKVRIKKHTKPATGLVRDDAYDWLQSAKQLLDEENVNIAVIAIGGNDRQDIRENGRRLKKFSREWRIEYLKRVARFAAVLAESDVAVYWVSLPIVRSSRMTKDYLRLNTYFRDIAESHGMKFISIEDYFKSKTGTYTAYGKGLNGRTRRLRDQDGIHFTLVGAKRLGQFVAREVRRDLREALLKNSDKQ